MKQLEVNQKLAEALGWELRRGGSLGYRLYNQHYVNIHDTSSLNEMTAIMADHVNYKLNQLQGESK